MNESAKEWTKKKRSLDFNKYMRARCILFSLRFYSRDANCNVCKKKKHTTIKDFKLIFDVWWHKALQTKMWEQCTNETHSHAYSTTEEHNWTGHGRNMNRQEDGKDWWLDKDHRWFIFGVQAWILFFINNNICFLFRLLFSRMNAFA